MWSITQLISHVTFIVVFSLGCNCCRICFGNDGQEALHEGGLAGVTEDLQFILE